MRKTTTPDPCSSDACTHAGCLQSGQPLTITRSCCRCWRRRPPELDTYEAAMAGGGGSGGASTTNAPGLMATDLVALSVL